MMTGLRPTKRHSLMKADPILPPASGELEEYRFNAFGDCLFIKFEPEDGLPWIGIFGKGEGVHNAVACSEFVAVAIAGGKAYYVRLDTKSLVYTTDAAMFCDVIATDDSETFVAINHTSIHLLSTAGHVWQSSRISWDGMRNASAQGAKVAGEAWSPLDNTWMPFAVDLKSRQVRGGSYIEMPRDNLDNL